MSLADQIAELESDLKDAQRQANNLYDSLCEARDYVTDLENDLEDANTFIAYVDKTHPELRTAFEASKKLEGQK